MCALRAAPSRHTSGHQKKNMHDTQGARFKACKELHNVLDFFDRYYDAHIWLHGFFERLQILHPRVGISGFGLRVHFLLAVVSFAWTVCTKEVCCIICLVSQPWNVSCIDNIFFLAKLFKQKSLVIVFVYLFWVATSPPDCTRIVIAHYSAITKCKTNRGDKSVK